MLLGERLKIQEQLILARRRTRTLMNSRGHGGLLYDAIVFPLLLKRVYDDKDVQEWIVRSSGLDWTIVRPGLLKDSPATGSYRVLTAPSDWRFGVISRADVADFLVRQVDDRTLIGTTPLLIASPERVDFSAQQEPNISPPTVGYSAIFSEVTERQKGLLPRRTGVLSASLRVQAYSMATRSRGLRGQHRDVRRTALRLILVSNWVAIPTFQTLVT